jgi:predicted nucleotidyltransferase
MPTDDSAFADRVAAALAGLGGVRAVALGGSRATGRHTPDSDWDFSLYYRGGFDPESLRSTGWAGHIAPIGGWGGGVFNGGAWLEVEGRRVDVHYRDLDDVEYRLAEARAGRFHVERLLFHLAGVPSYLPVAELAAGEVLRGDLPRPEFPDALRRTAPDVWWDQARLTLDYARAAHAARGHLTDTAGAVAVAAACAAHAVLAARATWVTNEKRLLDDAGLRGVDTLLAGLDSEPPTLMAGVDAAAGLLGAAVDEARGG